MQLWFLPWQCLWCCSRFDCCCSIVRTISWSGKWQGTIQLWCLPWECLWCCSRCDSCSGILQTERRSREYFWGSGFQLISSGWNWSCVGYCEGSFAAETVWWSGDSHEQYYDAYYLGQGRVVRRNLSQAARHDRLMMDQGRSDADLGSERCTRGYAV
jgi:hypothetical protein